MAQLKKWLVVHVMNETCTLLVKKMFIEQTEVHMKTAVSQSATLLPLLSHTNVNNHALQN